VRATTNNGLKGYIKADNHDLNPGETVSFAQDTFTAFYQKQKYVTGNKVKVLIPLCDSFSSRIATFIVASINNALKGLTWGTGSDVDMIENIIFYLPRSDDKIDFEFMESFVAELEARRIAELEARRIAELEAYLSATGLKDYTLTEEEKNALESIDLIQWQKYNVQSLFGKSTRGKRLKSSDRISGEIPFVTAGEANEGISAYIGNNVEIFSKNTTTIDMFGSAKYRNYNYGADDHIAVVHTETVPKEAAIFITTAIHKAAHTGEFHYGHNFYAKDTDTLDIMLPSKEGKPDYAFMEILISAIQKLVIKDVVKYADKKIEATKEVLEHHKK